MINYDTVLEILTEEASMEYFLRGLLPRILPQEYVLDKNCFIRPHQGKSDLQQSIKRKMIAYAHNDRSIKVLVVHDQDSNDCVALKETLKTLLTNQNGIPFLIRIACRELENWYLGDLNALAFACPDTRATQYLNKAKFRNPDNLQGTHEIRQMTNRFSKTAVARAMGPIIDINSNRSVSFIHFVNGLRNLLQPSA